MNLMCSDASMGIKIRVGKIYSDRKVTCVVKDGQTDVCQGMTILGPGCRRNLLVPCYYLMSYMKVFLMNMS